MTTAALLALALAAAPDENALRDAFDSEIVSKEPARRVEAVRKLAGAKEEKTVALLASRLKDPAREVQLAVAETLATVTDEAGAALKPLCAVLIPKKADPEVRLACARALAKSKYKLYPVSAMIDVISSISNEERHLHAFGADVVDILNAYTGEDFGKGRTTPALWEAWWDENKARLQKEDEARLEEYRKTRKK